MLTIEDCLALCELTEDEIDAIAEHERVPEMVAVELGNYLIHLPDGRRRISGMIRDDIRQARERGEKLHAAKLKLVLRHFLEHHAKNEAA